MAPSMAQPICKPKPMFVLKPKTPRLIWGYSRMLWGTLRNLVSLLGVLDCP